MHGQLECPFLRSCQKCDRQGQEIYSAWILGTVANGLLMAEAFRQGVGAIETEYAFELELLRLKGEIRVSSLRPQYEGDLLGIVTPNPCLFPRLSVGSAEEFWKLMHIVTNDLWSAAGTVKYTELAAGRFQDFWRDED